MADRIVPLEDRIVEELNRARGPVARRVLSEWLGVSGEQLGRALTRLRRAGRVEGDGYGHWALCTDLERCPTCYGSGRVRTGSLLYPGESTAPIIPTTDPNLLVRGLLIALTACVEVLEASDPTPGLKERVLAQARARLAGDVDAAADAGESADAAVTDPSASAAAAAAAPTR